MSNSRFKIKLIITGTPPEYMKVFAEKDKRGIVLFSNDNISWRQSKLKIDTIEIVRLYENIYDHISGCDVEQWMLFKLNQGRYAQLHIK